MKKLVALALGTVMAVSMTAGVSAATVESKDDLKNATIGVQLGTTGDIEASEYEADGATVKRYSKGSEAIQALMAGQIDCVIIDSQPAQKFVENADGLKILDEPFVEEEYAICLKKGNDELLDTSPAPCRSPPSERRQPACSPPSISGSCRFGNGFLPSSNVRAGMRTSVIAPSLKPG